MTEDPDPPKKGKLTVAEVREIKRMIRDGYAREQIADAFAISIRMVTHIMAGKYWSKVTID